MSRIRTIKPEFWTDDLLGSLSREIRLLFIATWNLADDEGILRWSAPFLRGAAFPFDEDLSISDVDGMMRELETVGVIFAYSAGRSQQKLAYVTNFHKHQRINRPSPSKLPPPPLQDNRVRYMYAARDGFMCHLCGGPIDEKPNLENEDFVISIDHVKPVSKGGLDYPSNVLSAHQCCNKGRGNRAIEDYQKLVREGKTAAQFRHPERFTHISSNDSVIEGVNEPHHDSLSNSVIHSTQEVEREREGETETVKDQEGKGSSSLRSDDARPKRAGSQSKATDAEFEEFYQTYPKHVNRSAAESKFRAVVKRGVAASVLIEAAGRYADAKRGGDPQFVKAPDVWLNKGCWTDELSAPQARAGPSPKSNVDMDLLRDAITRRQQNEQSPDDTIILGADDYSAGDATWPHRTGQQM